MISLKRIKPEVLNNIGYNHDLDFYMGKNSIYGAENNFFMYPYYI